MIHLLDETTSTNDEARRGDYAEGDIIWAENQTAGRGQRGHAWSSSRGLDATFSIVAKPSFIPAARQFAISRITALALADTFAAFGIAARIKWTNDIYVGDRKITGVLIENDLAGDMLARSVIGIGININSRAFDPSLPNPTSMAAECGREFDRREVVERLHGNFTALYASLKKGGEEDIHRRYDSLLYHLDEYHTFALPDGVRFEASVLGTEPSGRLILRHADGTVRAYAFREMEFVLKK